jgi:hypothetical protein
MPYQSKAERERPLWMTLVEALEHVQAHLAHQGREELGALRQLRMACGEADIPLRWAADAPLPGIYQVGLPRLFSPVEVPTDPMFWDHALIFLTGNGWVVDQRFLFINEKDHSAEHAPRPRELLLLRSRVLELWPLRSDAHEGVTAKDQVGSADQTSQPRPATDEEILEVVRELYRQAGNDPPNQTLAEQMVRALFPPGTTKRDVIRPILKRPEFVRRKPGRQPRHRKPGGQPER